MDVKGISKGKGTQGVMRRFRFAGGFKTHGASLSHRSPGALGGRRRSGKVWKGKKMAGKMGNEWHYIQNLLVFKIDFQRSLLYIKGSIPGNNGGLVMISDAFKKTQKQFNKLLFPTFLPEKGKEYPDIVEFTETVDLNEKFEHDNDEVLGISDEEDESRGAKDDHMDDDESAMKKE